MLSENELDFAGAISDDASAVFADQISSIDQFRELVKTVAARKEAPIVPSLPVVFIEKEVAPGDDKAQEPGEDREHRATELVASLLDSADPTDQKNGKVLKAMLADDKLRALALNIIEKLPDAKSMQAFLDVMSKPELKNATQVLTDLLAKKSEDLSEYAVLSLMQMLQSDDKSAKESAQRLLSALNDPAQADTGKVLLTKLLGGVDSAKNLRNAFALLDDPAQAQTAKSVLEMLKGGDDQEYRAGLAALNLLSGSDFSPAEKNALAAKLNNENTRKEVSPILAFFSNPTEAREMLSIAADPDFKVAAERLLQMIEKGGSSARTVSDLLGSITSNVDLDRSTGKSLLKLFNSSTPGDAESAEKILRNVSSLNQRSRMLDLMSDSVTKRGVESLLEILDSDTKRGRQPGDKLLALLGSLTSSDILTAEKMIRMLGQDSDSNATAQMLLRGLDETQLTAMMSVMESNADAGKTLTAWLAGNDAGKRTAAKALLDYRSTNGSTGTEALAKMIADPAQAAKALAILSLDDPSAIKQLMRVMENAQLRKGTEKLLEMLVSSNPVDRKSAKSLLEMMDDGSRSSDNTSRIESKLASSQKSSTEEAGEQLLEMLGTEQADRAKKILSDVVDFGQRGQLLRMNKSDAPTVARLLGMIGGPDRQTGLAILNEFDGAYNAAGMNKLMDILASKDLGLASSHLKSMLGSGGAKTLMTFLNSPVEKERQQAETMISTLNTTRTFTPLLTKLLNAQMSLDETVQLFDMMATSKTHQSGKLLMEALQYPFSKRGVSQMLTNLRSEDPQTKAAAEQLLQRSLGSNGRPEFLAMLRFAREGSVNTLARMLSNEKTKSAAEVILKLSAGEPQAEAFAQELLLNLASKNPKVIENAQKMVDLLASNDPQKRRLGEKLVAFMPEYSARAAFFALTEKNPSKSDEQNLIADRLLKLMTSDDPKENRGANAAVQMSSESATPAERENAKKLLQMLARTETDKSAESILKHLTTDQIGLFLQLMSDPKHAPGANVLLEVIKSGDLNKIRSVGALLENLSPRRERRLGEVRDIDGQVRGPDQEYLDLLAKLSDPKTAEFAKKTLLLAQTREELALPAKLLQFTQGQKTLELMMTMLAGDESRKDLAMTIIRANLSTDHAQQLLKMAGNPADKEAVLVLTVMLKDRESSGPFDATRLLDLRATAAPGSRQLAIANQLLKMYANPKTAEFANQIMSTANDRELPQLLHLLNGGHSEAVKNVLTELINSNNFADKTIVRRLLGNLADSDETKRKQGLRLLEMLSNDKHKELALRMLKADR